MTSSIYNIGTIREILLCSFQLPSAGDPLQLYLFYVNSEKGLRGTKIVKEVKFEGVCGEFESKKGFQRQSFTKYSRLTLVFLWNSALSEKLNFYFSKGFASINKIFILGGRLGTRLSFYEVKALSDIS